jgi:hypothetical protein
LAPSPLSLTTRDFFKLNLCGHSPYVISSDMTICLSLMNKLGLFKYTYHTYSMLLKILPFVLHTSPWSVQALLSRSCLCQLPQLAAYNIFAWTL